jgi:hypothetical protein
MNPRAEFDETAGFGDGLIVDKHLAGQDFAPSILAAFDQVALQQQQI